MAFFGTRRVLRVVRGGLRISRVCARCRVVSVLVEHRSRDYLAVASVPLVPVGAEERRLRCARCESTHYITPEDHLDAAGAPVPANDTVLCPHCQRTLRVPTQFGLLKLRCTACRGEFTIERSQPAGSAP